MKPTGARFGNGEIQGFVKSHNVAGVDDVLDQWVLTRIRRGRSIDIGEMWGARSRTLSGSSAEMRLWVAAAAAFEHEGRRAKVIDYIPFHHAATGVAAVIWS